MNFLSKAFTLIGPRLVGGAAAMAAGWVFVHTRGVVQLDPQQIVEVGGTMLATYGVAHKVVSNKVNPGDAANSRMVIADKDALNTGSAVIPPPPGYTRTPAPPNR